MLFHLKFAISDQHIPVKFERVQTATALVGGELYDGVVEITPSRETQTLQTTGKVLAEDITVNPIPKEYGLVTYDNRKVITIT